jgi:putative ABC transport system permease protein
MTLRDLVSVSTGNLWRMKLRTFLTVSGVVIAIAAFVSMLSFGAGNQKLVTKEFEDLGLFNMMQVTPNSKSEKADTAKTAVLDQQAVQRLAGLPGVNLAYPYEAVAVTAKLGDSTISTKAQALPVAAIHTKRFSQTIAGAPFASDSSREALITGDLLKSAGITNADSMIGQPIVVSVRVCRADSGFVHVLSENGESVIDRLKRITVDSLRYGEYVRRTVRNEANEAMGRFTRGFLTAKDEIVDTFTICGVLEAQESHRLRSGGVVMPLKSAQRFTGGFSGEPTELLAALTSGNLFGSDGESANKSYPVVTLDVDPLITHKALKDSIEAMGFHAFSFAEQFDEIRRFFRYFDMALGLIGLIALTTASLGIVNTMVMSTLERRREIGVLKSLGADDRDIRYLFLSESAMIGVMGSAIGLSFGWVISRIASYIAKMVMTKESIPPVELFALPYWLVLIALALGLLVSLLAGFYPASRAAKIDPVEALRND